MSLSTTQYGYIVDPMVPFTDDKGKTIKNGFIRVFMAGTSTPVLTYRNYDGATNQEKIELDNSGRVKHNVIGSKGSLYKVVVYNILHSQENPLLTVDKIAVLGASINATGATIVTGLDSVTVPEENFLKATVEGTGVELALDPTEVTSEVSTIGAAETAAPDYVVPLLEKTGTEDSKKISLANLFKFALDWISRLATTITSFASGDFIAVSNSTIGARKMSKDTLLELTAQNSLADNVAPAFDPTRTSENPYKAGEIVAYEGKAYMFKVDHYGAWDNIVAYPVVFSEVYTKKVDFSQKLETETFAGQQKTTTNNRLYLTFVPNQRAFKFVTRKKEYGSQSSYQVFFVDSTGVNSQVTYGTFNFDYQVVDVSLPSGYDTILLFNATYSDTIDVSVYYVNEYSTDSKLESLEGYTLGSFKKKWAWSASNSRLSFKIIPDIKKFKMKLEKVAYSGATNFGMFFQDSTNTNPQITVGYFSFGSEINVDIPVGYDTIYFFNATTATLIDVEAFVGVANSLPDALHKIENDISTQLGNPRTLIASQQAASSRLSLSVKLGSGTKVIRIVNISAAPRTCSVYFQDSTNTNQQVLYKHGVPFNVDIALTIPTGYDTILFFDWGVIENLNVEIYSVDVTSTAYKLEMCESELKYKGKKIICFGDSITEFKNKGMGYPDFLKYMTFATIVNAGIGGTHYSLRTDVVETPSSSNEAYAALDMYNLIHSWLTGNYTAVDNAVEYLRSGDDNSAQVEALKNNGVSGVDAVILFAGTNDWTWGASVGEVNNNNPKSILGALSMIIDELLAAKPTLKIFVFSPTVRWIDYSGSGSDVNKFSDVYQINGITLKELSTYIVEGVEKLHIPVCDLYNTLGWNQYNFSGYFDDSDGTHPNKGFESLAKRIYGFMQANDW